MSRTVVDSFNADGALGAPWTLLSGAASVASQRLAFTTAPGSNPLAVCELGLRSNGRADVDAAVRPVNVTGAALFVRVVDASNWVRAVLRAWTTSYQYYVTEYQHAVYKTEYSWWNFAWYDTYLARTLEREVRYQSGCSNGTWSGWSNSGSPTMCRANAPSAPGSDLGPCGWIVREYRYVTNNFQCGNASNNQYQLQQRTRTVTQNYSVKWVSDGYSPGTGENFTGGTRYVNGATYAKLSSTPKATAAPSASTGPSGVYDLYTGASLGVMDPNPYWAVDRIGGNDEPYGGSRQVLDYTYWDQNYEAGVPTRQTGPYSGTRSAYGVELEKCVAGAVASVAGPHEHGATSLDQLRVTAEGDQVKVYLNGGANPVLTRVCADHMATGSKVGLGGGASTVSPTPPAFDDFAARGISSEFVHQGGAMIRVDRKLRVGDAWVGVDPRIF